MKARGLLHAAFLAALTLQCTDNTDKLVEPQPTQHVFAIVDVMTLNHGEMLPEGYTGVAFSVCTNAYVPGVTGEFTVPSDVNVGIGGDTKYIFVKYQELPVNSEIPVLVDIEVAHWPQWRPYYDEGWEPAGPLTTGTWGACWRNGLNVKYLPLGETDSFILTLCLSKTEDGNLNSCPDGILVYEQYMPREMSALDIHSHCGDAYYVYLSYYRRIIVR